MGKRNGHKSEDRDGRRRFRETLFEHSIRLLKASPQDIEPEIERVLRLVRVQLSFDQLYIYRLSESNDYLTAAYASSVGKTVLPSTISVEQIPWIFEKIVHNYPVLLKHLLEDPSAEASRDLSLVQRLAVRSLLVFPITLEDQEKVWGMLWASCSNDEIVFQPTAALLEAFRNLISAAMQRNTSHLHITNLLQFDRLLFEISARYINLPVENIENIIRQDLERLGRQINADRCLLYLLDREKKSYRTSSDKFIWYPPEDIDAVRADEKFIASRPDFEAVYFPYAFEKWKRGETIVFSSPEDLPAEGEMFKIASLRFGSKSHLSVPMIYNQETIGALVILSQREHRTWHSDIIRRVRLFGEVFANALMRKKSDEKLNSAFIEIKQLKERIESDYIYLRDETEREYTRPGIIGESKAIKNVLVQIGKVASTDTTVLLLGETGTGKGVTARAIHSAGARNNRPLVQVNCAALAPSVIESGLFGHEKGAFTGADTLRRGRFEVADGATLFLDEIGELARELQAKLLRVIESGEFERMGGSKTFKTDVRIIAATNRNLEQDVAAGKFRSDLWYRLSVFPIYLPPLRERLEDIPLFVRWFTEKYGVRKGRNIKTISHKCVEQLKAYGWPGNVRELENIVERAIITCEGNCLEICPPNHLMDNPTASLKSYKDFERAHLLTVLQACGWKIQGSGGAAEILDINPATLRSRMKKLGITRPSKTNFQASVSRGING